MYKSGEKWFIHNQTVNVMLLVAATRRSDGILGGTGGLTQIVTIYYKGKTATIDVKVKYLTGILIDPNSTNRTQYKEGEKYIPTGLK